MLSRRLCRLLYALSKDARLSTKMLGKQLRMSQQNASYLISSAQKRGLIKSFYTLIDPARFGLTNILVLYNYKCLDQKSNDVIKALKGNPYVTMLETATLGADIIAQYTVPNLSLFNKDNQRFLNQFSGLINFKAAYPIIVKHVYTRKYLAPHSENLEWVLSGDRAIIQLSDKQKTVLQGLKQNPRTTLVALAKSIHLDVRTVTSIKKYLEKENVVRQYSVVLNHNKLGITRQRILVGLETTSPAELAGFLTYCNLHHNILVAVKLIGEFDFILTIEKMKSNDVLTDIRKNFAISDYKVMNIKSVDKSETVPNDVLNSE